MLGILELMHVARNELALASAAVPRLAGEGEGEAGAQQRGEHSVARLHRHRLVMTLEDDLHAAPGEPTRG
jgi:hypothetical protein